MIEKISERTNLKENLVRGIIYASILVLMLLFILFFNNSKKMRLNRKDFSNEDLMNLLNKINDNYSLTIEYTLNDKKYDIEYSRDSVLELYSLGDKGYLRYNGKTYEANEDNNKLKLVNDEIDDKYYNMNFIKKIMNTCKLEYVNNAKSICSISYADYLNYYNIEYNTNIEINYDNLIKFTVVHYSDRIVKIIVDYSDINKIINNSSDNINYGIKIENIDNNNFDKLLEYYKSELNK